MKAFIFSSALLALAAADTCTDCTAVVNTIAARLMEEESIVLQQVVFLKLQEHAIVAEKPADLTSRPLPV